MEELDSYFKYKCEKGFSYRELPYNDIYTTRLSYEVDTIKTMGFCGYFLIQQDLIDWARRNGIYVGPGRGSAAGSLVSYCLGITNLDPIRWDLIFERFLNPSRISMPDIDCDFEKERRDEVIEYAIQKYGGDKVAHIGTFGKLRAKAAVKTICRNLKHPYEVGSELSKLLLEPVHGKPQKLSKSFAEVPKLKRHYEDNDTYGEILHWAEKVEDSISNIGIHASGIVISNTPLMETVPLYRGKNGEIVTQWEMNNIEEVGLIKFDFLGLDALTKIHRCIDLVKERHGVDIDIDSILLNDAKVFENLRGGDSVGIFQLEASAGMRELLMGIRPNSVEDLISLVAIYRPGPLAAPYKNIYLAVRAGEAEPEYLVPELEPILKKTEGWLIYQEQCMRIASKLCGYSDAEADNLRKAIGKKKAKMMAEHEEKFKEGWVKGGLDAEKGNEMWNQMVAFAAYGFNRSHAAAYAYITYQTAWLKTHYPIEFMCAIMISEAGNQDDIIKCITECKERGFKILPPDINISHETFSIDDDTTIRFGLGPIKNLGNSITSILEARKNGPFTSLRNFCERIDLGVINSLKMESLIKTGAFDKFEMTRASLLMAVELIWEYRKQMKLYESKAQTYERRLDQRKQRFEDIKNGKLSLKGNPLKELKEPTEPEPPIFPEIPELVERSEHDILVDEHELLGFYVTSHPLEKFNRVRREGIYTIEEVKEFDSGSMISIGAVAVSKKEITTKKTSKRMAFVTIEDMTGSLEAVCFPRVYGYRDHQELLDSNLPLQITGHIEVIVTEEGKAFKLKVKKISELQMPVDRFPDAIEESKTIEVTIDITKVGAAIDLLKKYQGNLHKVSIVTQLRNGALVTFAKEAGINNLEAFQQEIKALL